MSMTRRAVIGSASVAVLGGLFGAGAFAAPKSKKFAVTRTDADWRKRLGAERFAVLRQEATERPYSSPLLNEKRAGTYLCAGCALPVFASKTKYDSKTGWPSFWQPLGGAIGTYTDMKVGFPRTEVHCSRCGGHLGHVFDDGPKPTGKRYCLNGDALTFKPG